MKRTAHTSSNFIMDMENITNTLTNSKFNIKLKQRPQCRTKRSVEKKRKKNKNKIEVKTTNQYTYHIYTTDIMPSDEK